MKKIALLILFAFFCSFGFIGCKKCHKKKLGDIKLSESELNIVPYKGTGDLTFRDSNNYTIVYHPDSYHPRESYYHDVYEHYEHGSIGSEPEEPCGNYYTIEENITNFKGKQCYNYIQIDLKYDSVFTNIKTYFHILVSYEIGEQWCFSNGFYYDSGNFYDYLDTNTVILSDSLQIGPNHYHHVYTFIQNGGNIGYELIQYLYYTMENGIVGFKTKTGHLWYLVQ